MRAGKLRHRVEIQVPDEVADSMLGRKPDPTGDGSGWSTIGHAWANVTTLSTRERLIAGANMSSITTKVYMRWDSRVNTTARLKFGTRVLNVIGPPFDAEGRKREMTLTCEERS